jgi:hypothetical protein
LIKQKEFPYNIKEMSKESIEKILTNQLESFKKRLTSSSGIEKLKELGFDETGISFLKDLKLEFVDFGFKDIKPNKDFKFLDESPGSYLGYGNKITVDPYALANKYTSHLNIASADRLLAHEIWHAIQKGLYQNPKIKSHMTELIFKPNIQRDWVGMGEKTPWKNPIAISQLEFVKDNAAAVTKIDQILADKLKLKEFGEPQGASDILKEEAKDYFLSKPGDINPEGFYPIHPMLLSMMFGKHAEKGAFLAELQQALIKNGIIKTDKSGNLSKITEKDIGKFRQNYKGQTDSELYQGVIKGSNFPANIRILDISENTNVNNKLMADLMNKYMPILVAMSGSAAISAEQNEKGNPRIPQYLKQVPKNFKGGYV